MIAFPEIDPVAFRLGPVAVHWYGLAYITGIAAGWVYLQRQAAAVGGLWSREDVADVVFYAALGAVLGGRIGYILFYNAAAYIDAPWSIFAVWRGGMSFHGGAIGLTCALAWFARTHGRRFLVVSDFLVPAVPIGLGLGRVANFINQELWGAPTTLPWGVVFTVPAAAGVARHPSQLYEAALEGLVLFLVLHWLSRRALPAGCVTGACLMLYALFRGAVEFVREPDAHIGYLAGGWLTMGQLLSLPMLVAGCGLVIMHVGIDAMPVGLVRHRCAAAMGARAPGMLSSPAFGAVAPARRRANEPPDAMAHPRNSCLHEDLSRSAALRPPPRRA